MTTNANSRRAHALLDKIANSHGLGRDDVEHLRSYLPAPPKQMTLQQIIAHVDDAWAGAGGDDWGGNSYDSGVSLEDWLLELHAQLQGLQDHQTAADSSPKPAPGLPDGMRLATHPDYGLCVVSPTTDGDGDRKIFFLSDNVETGADCRWVPVSNLISVDGESAYPGFLQGEAEYDRAPDGTIVACEDSSPWYKSGSEWSSVDFCGVKDDKGMSRARRRVLRWGYGND